MTTTRHLIPTLNVILTTFQAGENSKKHGQLHTIIACILTDLTLQKSQKKGTLLGPILDSHYVHLSACVCTGMQLCTFLQVLWNISAHIIAHFAHIINVCIAFPVYSPE